MTIRQYQIAWDRSRGYWVDSQIKFELEPPTPYIWVVANGSQVDFAGLINSLGGIIVRAWMTCKT